MTTRSRWSRLVRWWRSLVDDLTRVESSAALPGLDERKARVNHHRVSVSPTEREA